MENILKQMTKDELEQLKKQQNDNKVLSETDKKARVELIDGFIKRK